MMKQRAFRGTRLLSDPIEAAPLETVVVKFLEGGCEDSAAGGFGISWDSAHGFTPARLEPTSRYVKA